MAKSKPVSQATTVAMLAEQVDAFGMDVARLEDGSEVQFDACPAVGANHHHLVEQLREQLRTAHAALVTARDEVARARGFIDSERQHHRALFERAPDPQFATDRMGVVHELNPAAIAFLRHEAAAVQGKPLSMYITRETMDSYRNAIDRVGLGLLVEAHVRWRVADAISPFTRLRGWLTSNPHRVLWTVLVTTTSGVEPRAIGASGVGRMNVDGGGDVDFHPPSSEDDTGPASDGERILAAISHEFRDPLQSVLAWANLLRRGRLTTAQRDRAYEVIERNLMLQASTLEGLLDVSRLATRHIEIEQRAVDLSAVVSFAADAVRPLALQTGIKLQVDVHPDTRVVGDAMRLTQVTMNLLSNALKFTPPAGTIVIRLRVRAEHAVLSVMDTGVGISVAAMPQIFDCFVQEGTPTKARSGLGLGLFIVKKLTELHGGAVSAHSEGLGRGATFVITLPLAG